MLAMLAVATLWACEKEGPEGPQGPQGENAEMIIKNAYVYPSNWNTDQNPSSTSIEIPELTEEVLNNSTIQVFQKTGEVLFPLPITRMESTFFITEQFFAAPGAIGIFLDASDDQPRWFNSTVEYHIVIAEAAATKSSIARNIHEQTGLTISEEATALPLLSE